MQHSILKRLLWLNGSGFALITIILVAYSLMAANSTLKTVSTQMEPMVSAAAAARMEALALRSVQPLQNVFKEGDELTSALLALGKNMRERASSDSDNAREFGNLMVRDLAQQAPPTSRGLSHLRTQCTLWPRQ